MVLILNRVELLHGSYQQWSATTSRNLPLVSHVLFATITIGMYLAKHQFGCCEEYPYDSSYQRYI